MDFLRLGVAKLREQRSKAANQAAIHLGAKVCSQNGLYERVTVNELDSDAGLFSIDEDGAGDLSMCAALLEVHYQKLHLHKWSQWCREQLTEMHHTLVHEAAASISATESHVRWLREERQHHDQQVRELHMANSATMQVAPSFSEGEIRGSPSKCGCCRTSCVVS